MKNLRITITGWLFLFISPLSFAAGTANTNYDIIVVGGGAAGGTAALTAAEAGRAGSYFLSQC